METIEISLFDELDTLETTEPLHEDSNQAKIIGGFERDLNSVWVMYRSLMKHYGSCNPEDETMRPGITWRNNEIQARGHGSFEKNMELFKEDFRAIETYAELAIVFEQVKAVGSCGNYHYLYGNLEVRLDKQLRVTHKK